jgi:hypothetical protein
MGNIEDIPLRKGIDYDLVNISLLGVDPVSGRSFDECHKEWAAALGRVQERANRLRWWDLPERLRIARKLFILTQRQGLQGYRL